MKFYKSRKSYWAVLFQGRGGADFCHKPLDSESRWLHSQYHLHCYLATDEQALPSGRANVALGRYPPNHLYNSYDVARSTFCSVIP